jgi:hypothetical protein
MRFDGAALAGVWRDHDDEVRQLDGMKLADSVSTGGDLAVSGARRVALAAVVDVADAEAAVPALTTVRELTSLGIAVDWRINLEAATFGWKVLSHLYPPTELTGVDQTTEILDLWRAKYYFCKCVYRAGPDFLQIRDRRGENLARFTVDDPRYLVVIDQLLGGARADCVPEDVAQALLAEELVVRIGALLWFAPYRVRRWPVPSPVV